MHFVSRLKSDSSVGWNGFMPDTQMTLYSNLIFIVHTLNFDSHKELERVPNLYCFWLTISSRFVNGTPTFGTASTATRLPPYVVTRTRTHIQKNANTKRVAEDVGRDGQPATNKDFRLI